MAEADAGNKRRRSGRLSGQPPEQALNIDLERRTSRNSVASSVNPPTGQQPHGRSASAGAQHAKGQHKGKEPLEAFVSVLDTYCGPQSDGDVLDAAQSVAELWQLKEKEARAALQKVVGPLLEREQQLADRAAAIAALKQTRRDKFVQHGPRVTRQRATEGQQEPADSSGPADGVGANNGSGSHNSSRTSSKRARRTADRSNPQQGPVLPSSPLLNNRQDKGHKPPTPAPADLEGSSSEAFAGSGSGHGSGSTDGGSDSSRLTPGVESGGSEQAHKQQQQLADGTRSASRRKQQWRPCHAALQ